MNYIGQSFGRYHILEQLGEGGMATVYKAYDTRLERDVAIKVIRLDQFTPASLQSVLARFEREAKSLARLTHPNIVHISDYGEQDNVPYLVMDYLPGGTLKDRMGQPTRWQEACKLLLPIAQALDYAHEQNLIHRDVKPSNILMTQKGQPMLTDFGIAKILDAGGQTLTATGVGIGTPEYMAPEQWTGKTTAQSDIYSLGVVMYEMVTGRTPYIADTPAAILIKQATEPLPRPKQYIPDLPEAVEKVLIKSMAKEPADRYQTMDDFARALEGLLLGDVTREVPIPPTMAAVAGTLTGTETPASSEPEKTADLKTMAVIDEKEAGQATVIASQPSGHAAAKESAGKLAMRDAGKPAAKSPLRWWPWVVAGIAVIGGVWLTISFIKPLGTVNVNPTSAATVPLAATLVKKPAVVQVSPEQCATPRVFCVGLVTDVGPVNDNGFNQAAWKGVLYAKEQGLADWVQFIETKDVADYDNNIRVFAEGGYDAIVTVGWMLGEATRNAALRYPGVHFIGVDQLQDSTQSRSANLIGLTFPEDQAGFLVGALAARISKTSQIAAVCGPDSVPPVWRYCEGYRAGAAFADQQTGRTTIVDVVYYNGDLNLPWSDPEWGAAIAKALMDKGADTIFGAGGETGYAAVTAAAQAGRYAIGVDVDQYHTLPEAAPRLLSSATKVIAPSVFDLIKAAKEDSFSSFPDGNYIGGAGFAPYHDLENEVPAEVKVWMEDLLTGLYTCKIQTNVPTWKPTDGQPVAGIPYSSGRTACRLAAYECKDALGCVTIKPGEPVHIAYALVVAGPNKTLGVDSRNGVEIAIADAGGKILGHDVKFDGQDTGCSAETGQAAAAKLSSDTTIVAVIGTSCSSEARVGVPLMSKAGFVVVSPSNTDPDLTEAGNPNNYPGYLRTAHNDLIQGAKAADYVYNVLGVRRVATIHDGSLYADNLQQVFAENFKKLGGTITAQTAVDPAQTDMSSVLADIAAGSPELIYFPIFMPAGPFIILQAKTTPGLENVKLMGADGLFSPDVTKAAGAAVEGFKVSSPLVTGAAYDTFVQKYKAKFGKDPISIFHAHAYDAFNMIKAGIVKVAIQQPDGTLIIPRQALRDALVATKDFQGLTGVLSCTPTGDCANPVIGIYEYHKGQYPPTLIYPK
jgi:branched-chain amino acid transport system substrate-binding protein